MTLGLSVSRLINVTVTLTPRLAPFPDFSTCLILGTSDVIDVVERMRSFNTIAEVAAAFGTSAEEYLAAVLWFEQRPQPNELLIGRWAKTATAGQLIGGGVSVANQLYTAWTGINNGGFAITIDGVGPTQIANLDFSAVTNLNGVASVIESGFPGGTTTVVWDLANERFVATNVATGATSTLSFAVAPAAGTDISAMLAWTGTAGDGSYLADGVDAQSALDTVVLFDNQFGSGFYGLTIPSASDADHLAVFAYIEADDPPHFYGISTQEAGVVVSTSATDIAYLVKALGYNKGMVQYSSTNAYSVVSAMARILTTNWAGNNTTITLMYKQEPGIVAETLTASQMDALLAKNCNVFVNYNNGSAILQPGICPSGQFADTIIFCDWFRAEVQTNEWNILYGSATKVPQTDAGMGQLATGITAACVAGVNNGGMAPGTWNADGFGQIKQGDFLPLGYYIYQPPISSQSETDRMARKSVPFQVAIKLGGAVHSGDISVLVNP
jgi:hypothetical protein